MTAADWPHLALCEHVGTRWDPKAECGNRARWRADATGRVYCGRHLRYVGPVQPLLEKGSPVSLSALKWRRVGDCRYRAYVGAGVWANVRQDRRTGLWCASAYHANLGRDHPSSRAAKAAVTRHVRP